MNACGFTGYRFEKLPFSRGDAGAIASLKLRLYSACERALDMGCTRFISGFAQGSDLIFAEAVLDLRAEYEGVELEAALPFAEPERNWTLTDQRQFRSLLSCCDLVHTLRERYAPGCYHERNDYILKNSDRLIAVFCPEDKRQGGTAYTVRRAQRLDIPIEYLVP